MKRKPLSGLTFNAGCEQLNHKFLKVCKLKFSRIKPQFQMIPAVLHPLSEVQSTLFTNIVVVLDLKTKIQDIKHLSIN